MGWPKAPSQNTMLLALLGLLMISSVLYTRESLLFCEKALFGETRILEKETKMEKAVRFSDVCPEVRQKAENQLNRWLEVILALLVNLSPHPPKEP